MSVTTDFVDRADGTGADVTVDGTFVGAVVYVAEEGTDDWFAAGANAGPDHAVVALPLTVGLYLGTVYYSDNGTFQLSTFPKRFRVTDGSESAHWRIMSEIKTIVQTVTAGDVVHDNVIIEKVLTDRNVGTINEVAQQYSYPCIKIVPYSREKMPPNAGTNIRDDVVYPTLVALLNPDNQDLTTSLNDYLKIRERMIRAFRNQALADANITGESAWWCEVVPLDIVNATDFIRENTFVTAFVINTTNREPRGIA